MDMTIDMVDMHVTYDVWACIPTKWSHGKLDPWGPPRVDWGNTKHLSGSTTKKKHIPTYPFVDLTMELGGATVVCLQLHRFAGVRFTIFQLSCT